MFKLKNVLILLLLGMAAMQMMAISSESNYTYRTDTATAVYNLEANGNHNYYVSPSGVLVHNCETKLLSRFAENTIEEGVQTTLMQKAIHIFEGNLHPKPYLDVIANSIGGRGNLIRSALKQNINNIPLNGKFELPFKIGNNNLIMRGYTNKGVPIINTIFKP